MLIQIKVEVVQDLERDMLMAVADTKHSEALEIFV